jgi:hypothetical protein
MVRFAHLDSVLGLVPSCATRHPDGKHVLGSLVQSGLQFESTPTDVIYRPLLCLSVFVWMTHYTDPLDVLSIKRSPWFVRHRSKVMHMVTCAGETPLAHSSSFVPNNLDESLVVGRKPEGQSLL